MTALPGPAWLFCPADRPDRYPKAAAAGDVVILDLEDAVAPSAKAFARESLAASDLDPEITIVRVNPASSPEHARDVRALARTPYRRVMLPKAEDASDLEALRGREIIALCETSRGVLGARELAEHDQVIALTWGAEDLLAALGGTSSRDEHGRYRDVARYARSQVLLAAAAAGKAAADTVYLDIDDDAGLAATAVDAAESGFAAMMCVHPAQVPTVRAGFAPSPERFTWARGVLAAAEESGHGVFTYRGQMIDEPLVHQARRILGGKGR